MFLFGDLIDDINTFQWLPFAETITVSLKGSDGEKRIAAKFRNAARNESAEVETHITLEANRPRLLPDVNLLSVDGREDAILLLIFDESIDNVSKEGFHLSLSNPANVRATVEFDNGNVKPILEGGKVVVQINPEQLDKILQLRGENLLQAEIQMEIAENSVHDAAEKGNLSNADSKGVITILQMSPLTQADLAFKAFSPNGDEVKDAISISYALSSDAIVRVLVKDQNDEQVDQLINEIQPANTPLVATWDGKSSDDIKSPEGIYTMEIVILDPLINVPITVKSWQLLVDNTPPEIVKVSPADGRDIVGQPKIAVHAIDPGVVASGVDTVLMRLKTGEELPLQESVAEEFDAQAMSEAQEFMIPEGGQLNLPLGEQKITFRAVDVAGNESGPMTVNYMLVATHAMSIMNYPNPFAPGHRTTIKYVLGQDAQSGMIRIYDAAGELVFFKELKDDERSSDQEYELPWNGTDLFGNPLARGIYFCELRVTIAGNSHREQHKIAVW
jgi:flagellar hook assembly protein FlgD